MPAFVGSAVPPMTFRRRILNTNVRALGSFVFMLLLGAFAMTVIAATSHWYWRCIPLFIPFHIAFFDQCKLANMSSDLTRCT